MEESRVLLEDFLSLYQQRINMEESNMRTELEMMEVVKNMEDVRRRWMQAELELKKFKEQLVKSDVAKAALEVTLKHTRYQLDLEIKKRHKVEADYHYLQKQMQLMCDILVHDSKSNACLNDEQKSLLATFDHKGTNVTLQRSSKRLTVIDESSFLFHSDISYDRTDDDVDLDTTKIKPLRSRARERRRSSMGPAAGSLVGKQNRSGNGSAELLDRKIVEKEVETIAKAVVTSPDTNSQIHMMPGKNQKGPDKPAQNITQEGEASVGGANGAGGVGGTASAGGTPRGDQTSIWFPCEKMVVEPEPGAPSQDDNVSSTRMQKTLKHVFLSKTVIRPEKCMPCGKRIRFGKVVVKCRNCRVVAHPECKQRLPNGCSPCGTLSPSQAVPDFLEGFAPLTHPRVPQLIVNCVAEIERRGLQERGLYRVSGSERSVKELRDRYLQGNLAPMLSKVQDIHVVCGVLKDFLRKLKEPLITFRLHRIFMEASELSDEDEGLTIICRAVAKLPKSNRDTLAFLMLHFHKVMRSPQCQMDQNNLARVFGPTVVGHGMSEPSPTTIMRDTSTQPKVMHRLLSIPEDYWKQVLSTQMGPVLSGSSSNQLIQDERHGRFFEPLTSPELKSFYKPPSPASVLGRIKNLGAQPDLARRVFTSPS